MRFTDWVYWQKTFEWGATARLSPEQELVKLALTSFVKKWFYESEADKISRIQDASRNVDDEFALKLAAWARDNGLRTVNQMILIEKIKSPLFQKAFQHLVKRPDELLDLVWYYAMINNQHLEKIILANKLKKAIKTRLELFSDYQLAKYRWKGSKINLYDLVNMVHAHSESIGKLMKWTLETANTWESKLSSNGNTKESWNELLDSKSLWALAFVRNLRNMLDAWIPQDKLGEYAKEMDFKKVYPFQVIQALWIACASWLSYNSTLFHIMEQKIKESMWQFTTLLTGRVAIGIDTSWSMYTNMSGGALQYIDMACYYGAYLAELCDWDLYFWSDKCRKIDYKNKNITSLSSEWYSHGTYLSSFINEAKWYDTLFVITDEQVHDRNLSQTDATNKIIRNIQDHSHSVAELYWWTYITWLDDRLLWLVWDLRNIDELVDTIKSIEI